MGWPWRRQRRQRQAQAAGPGNGHTAQKCGESGQGGARKGTATLPKVPSKWAGERPHCPMCGESGPGNGHTAQNAAKAGWGTATKLKRPHCPTNFRLGERPHWLLCHFGNRNGRHCPKWGETGPRNGHTASHFGENGHTAQFTFGGTATLHKTLSSV